MAQVVAFEINVNGGNAEKSILAIKTELKNANKEIQTAAEQFGLYSQQVIDAEKKVGVLKNQLSQATEQSRKLSAVDKLTGFNSALNTIAGGISTVIGAQTLLGASSEDVEKQLAKVQGALALSQGIQSLAEAGKGFNDLKKVAVNALNSIKSAIGSTGIGLLVIALGVIVAYWDDIKSAVSGVSEEQKKLLETQKKSAAAAEKSLDSISKSENILKLNGLV